MCPAACLPLPRRDPPRPATLDRAPPVSGGIQVIGGMPASLCSTLPREDLPEWPPSLTGPPERVIAAEDRRPGARFLSRDAGQFGGTTPLLSRSPRLR